MIPGIRRWHVSSVLTNLRRAQDELALVPGYERLAAELEEIHKRLSAALLEPDKKP